MKARIPKGFGGGIPNNMQGMIKQAQKMQEDIAAKQEEINNMEFKASSGGGVVSVSVNGKHEITGLTLKPEIVDPEDIEMLQDLILAAANEALRQVDEVTNQEMGKVTGGLSLPGLL